MLVYAWRKGVLRLSAFSHSNIFSSFTASWTAQTNSSYHALNCGTEQSHCPCPIKSVLVKSNWAVIHILQNKQKVLRILELSIPTNIIWWVVQHSVCSLKYVLARLLDRPQRPGDVTSYNVHTCFIACACTSHASFAAYLSSTPSQPSIQQ